MKQTNNAIKFLMAQFRAIFKNANIAMVAAMVASALAVSQAQAAGLNLSQDKAKPTDSLEISEKIDASGNAGGFVNNITIKDKGTLNFDGSTTANTGHISVANTLTVQSGGTLNLTGPTAGNGGGWGVVGTHEFDKDKNPLFDNANSTFNLESGGAVTVTKSQIQMTNVNLNGGTVTIATNHQDNANSDFADNAQINAITNAAGQGGVLTVNGATVNLNNGSILNGKTVDLKKGTIKMSGDGATSGSGAVVRAFGGGSVNLAGADLTTDGTGNYIAAATVNMTSGTVTIKKGTELHLVGAASGKKNLADAAAGQFNISGDLYSFIWRYS